MVAFPVSNVFEPRRPMVNVDTKLLVIFVELLSKRNATYVAEKMHIRRLRTAAKDALGNLYRS